MMRTQTLLIPRVFYLFCLDMILGQLWPLCVMYRSLETFTNPKASESSPAPRRPRAVDGT
ncbi:hypothetical protein BC827DRAFT_1236760 [Russula dissimulans]|nr:hypothetical protein BC827DRAFT_1236760 [Russula dissimulans]